MHRVLAYAYCRMGDMKRARQMTARVLTSERDFNSEVFGKKLPFKDPAMKNRIIETWKKAEFR